MIKCRNLSSHVNFCHLVVTFSDLCVFVVILVTGNPSGGSTHGAGSSGSGRKENTARPTSVRRQLI